MVRNYILKRPVLDANRLQKISKKILSECSEDRAKALEVHQYFKDMVEDNPQDAAAKSLMVDCLKLAQSSKVNAIKLINLLIKMEGLKESDSTDNNFKSAFSELDALSNE
tara:strand:- start:131 stop:460 length:330 start_codon:yes stop_codon:yes gene_type:complete